MTPTQELSRARAVRRARAGAVLVAAAVLCGASQTIPAASADDPKDKINAAQEELESTSKDLIAADAKLKETAKKLSQAQKDADAASAELKAAQGKQATAKSAAQAAQQKSDAAQQALQRTTAEKNQAVRDVGSIARYSFESGGLGPLTFTIQMLSSKHDTSGAMAVSEALLQRQGADVDRLKSVLVKQQQASDSAAERSRQAQLAKSKEDAAVLAASDASSKASNAEKKLQQLQASQEADKKALEEHKKAAQAELDAAKAEQERVQQVTMTSGALDPASVSGVGQKGFLTAPGPISSIVSPFGYRIHPVLHYRKLHAGDDFPFACGRPVFAAADGTVIEAGYNDVSGNHVILSHGSVNGVQLATGYMHFTSISVSVGQRVKRGQQIGLSGTTGRSTGCHLHFEVRENGVPVNPVSWIS